MGSAPSPPPAPNAQAIASAQQGSNIQTAASQAALNNVNQQGPLGNLTYTQTGTGPNGVPTYTANNNSAFQGGINANTNAFNNQTPLDAQNMVQQSLQLGSNYLQPYFQQQQQQLQGQLQNQGFDPNSTAAQFATNNLMNQQDTALGSMLPGLEQSASTAYMMPLQAAGGAAGATTGGYINTPQTGVSPTNVEGAYQIQQNALQNNYDAQMQNYSSMMGGLFGIPSAMLGGWAKSGFPGASSFFDSSNWNSSLPSGSLTGF